MGEGAGDPPMGAGGPARAVRVEAGRAGGGAAPPPKRYTRAGLAALFGTLGVKAHQCPRTAKRAFARLVARAGAPGAPLLPRAVFLEEVRAALEDLGLQCVLPALGACLELRERRSSVCVLLLGTSGTGKSTLASLVASRLGISAVLSTDSVRSVMRSFARRQESPVLWASSYDAGVVTSRAVATGREAPTAHGAAGPGPGSGSGGRGRVLAGCREQIEMVLPALQEAIASCARRNESVVVEGVHLSVEAALQLMRQHSWVVPFLVYISNESKHLERFAVRARYMALTAAKNRYVHFFQNIRTIQADMCTRADAVRIPKIDNTNVDRSVAMIHDVTLEALREVAAGGSLLDDPDWATPGELTAGPLFHKYESCLVRWPWSSKQMIKTIRERGSLKSGGYWKGSGGMVEGDGSRGSAGTRSGTGAAVHQEGREENRDGVPVPGQVGLNPLGEELDGRLLVRGSLEELNLEKEGSFPLSETVGELGAPGRQGFPSLVTGTPQGGGGSFMFQQRSHSLDSESPSLAEETDAEGGPMEEDY